MGRRRGEVHPCVHPSRTRPNPQGVRPLRRARRAEERDPRREEGTVDHKSLHRLYGGLTGEERFRMLLQVSARGDDREARYLIESTPWVEGVVCDREFATPGHASFRLAAAYARFAGQ